MNPQTSFFSAESFGGIDTAVDERILIHSAPSLDTEAAAGVKEVPESREL
jgi:hypothetical protein